MNSRELALVIYAGILGWYLHKWWERERECLVWTAAERAAALSEARKPPESPAAESPATG